MHDLGSSFPNATGHPDGRDEYMPVEECGNMLIMGASVVGNLVEENGGGEKGRKVAKEWLEGAWGDGGRFRGRYDLWRKWTGYLVEFGLLPATQCMCSLSLLFALVGLWERILMWVIFSVYRRFCGEIGESDEFGVEGDIRYQSHGGAGGSGREY